MALESRIRGRLLALGLGVAAVCVLGEIAARGLDLVDRLNGFPRRLFMATDHPHLGYVLRPGVDTIARGVRVRINAWGMRGPEVAQRPAPGTLRIAVLGDSVAFGSRLEGHEAFPELLAHELKRRGPGQVEVLNAGVEGYNTRNQRAFLEQRVIGLAPQTLVLAFNLNDYDYGPVMGPLGVLTRDREKRVGASSLANRSELLLVLRWLIASATGGIPRLPASQTGPLPPGEFHPLDRHVSALRKAFYRRPEPERWQVMLDSLRGIADLAERHDLWLLVAILPDGDQVGVADPDLTPQDRLRRICRDLDLSCLDLHPIFQAEGSQALFLDIMHPNAKGHRLIARAVADRLLAGRP